MFYILVALLISVLIYGPHLWVRVVLSRYSREIPGLPGTGGELAQHLLNRFQFDTVKVEQSEPDNNHYSPTDNAVRLSPDVYNGKSLTAIAVAAHEVGHAIQFNREEPVSQLRARYLGGAQKIQRAGAIVLMLVPLILAIIHIPHLTLITLVIGVITMLASSAVTSLLQRTQALTIRYLSKSDLLQL